jgi:adenylosuccinate synthase
MKLSVVIGAGFGDEGKGRTVSYLCAQAERNLVVRFNGGQQAAHTVAYNGHRHIFSQFGSGTFQGAPTFISDLCCVYPKTLVNEYNALNKVIKPLLYIAPNTPITTPFDVHMNRRDHRDLARGTCGLGTGTTFQREADHYHLHFMDLYYPKVVEMKMKAIQEYYGLPEDEALIKDIDAFYKAIDFMNDNYIGEGAPVFEDFDQIVFEGAQGLLLDQTIGFFPNVTRSNTGSKNVVQLIQDLGLTYDEYETIYVTRAYSTRHGNGPMSDERNLALINNEVETNVSNKYQGSFRTGLLDLDLLHYAKQKDLLAYEHIIPEAKISLMVTCLDQLNEIRVIDNGREVVYSSKVFPSVIGDDYDNLYFAYGENINDVIDVTDSVNTMTHVQAILE